jgi:hypothetical protein
MRSKAGSNPSLRSKVACSLFLMRSKGQGQGKSKGIGDYKPPKINTIFSFFKADVSLKNEKLCLNF